VPQEAEQPAQLLQGDRVVVAHRWRARHHPAPLRRDFRNEAVPLLEPETTIFGR
jgi:hypothetical protein